MKNSGWMQIAVVTSMFVAGTAHADANFGVLGTEIGAPIGAAGFTCTKAEPGKARDCVKFTDARCNGKTPGIGTLRYGEDPPPGCYLDTSTRGTYLDGKLQQTPNTGDATDKRPVLKPLDNLHVTGTLTNKIYQINYMTEKDDLAEDSKLYKALRGKFGEPTDKNPPNAMKWRRNGAELKASCDRIHCEIFIIDRKLRDMEDRSYEEGVAKSRRQNAPDPKI